MESIRRRLWSGSGNPPAVNESTRDAADEWSAEAAAEVKVEPQPESLHADTSPGLSSRSWTLDGLLKTGKRFKPIRRISATLPEPQVLRIFQEHETSGIPLIISDWHKKPKWPKDLFSIDWLLEHCGDNTWDIRDVRNRKDIKVTLTDFIQWSRQRASTGVTHTDQLLYGKDAPCPPEWRKWVNNSELLPEVLCPHGPTDFFRNLPKTEGVESLMCYLGIGDTFTPCHKDLCASSGQNIMCYTEDDGSSFWFMTSSSDAPKAAEYFQKHIGQELDWEAHTVTVDEFADAPFTTYIAEQKLGDLVLVPPRSCHQVVNHGGLTVKTSWSRMTLQGLMIALHHELPIYQRVCREEQYRVKHIIYRSLLQCASHIQQLQSYFQNGFDSPPQARNRLPSLEAHMAANTSATSGSSAFASANRPPILSRHTTQLRTLGSDLRLLIDLFDLILHEEYAPTHKQIPALLKSASVLGGKDLEDLPAIFTTRSPAKRQPKLSMKASSSHSRDAGESQGSAAHNFACDFCGADIFQSFFECMECRPMQCDDEDGKQELQYGDGLLICSRCYAEGRTCQCQLSMYPLQCRPFSDLLRDRNEAVRVSQGLVAFLPGSQSRHQVLDESQLMGSAHLNLFAAGCQLVSLREQASSTSQTRKCRCGTIGPKFEVIYCTACHTSKCYKELLRLGLHSSEVVLRGLSSASAFHDLHRERSDSRGNKSRLRDAERSGEVIDHKDRLVFVAQRYSTCRPANPENVRKGWYDELNSHSFDADEAPDTHTEDVKPTVTQEDGARLETCRHTLSPPSLKRSDSPPTDSNNSLRNLVCRPAPQLHRMEVVVKSRKGTHFRSHRSLPAAPPPMDDHEYGQSEDDDNLRQNYAGSVVQAMNAANDHQTANSSSHVRRRRVYSSSPEDSPQQVENLLEGDDDDDERPSPPKKRRLKESVNESKREDRRPTTHFKHLSVDQAGSTRAIKGSRGCPPGKKTLQSLSTSGGAKSIKPEALVPTPSLANAVSVPPSATPTHPVEIAQLYDLISRLAANQQPIQPIVTHGPSSFGTSGSIPEHEDPMSRKVLELMRSFTNEVEGLKRQLTRNSQKLDAEATAKCQSCDQFSQRLENVEARNKDLENRIRQQAMEMERQRDMAETRVKELDRNMRTMAEEFSGKFEALRVIAELKAPHFTTSLSVTPHINRGTASVLPMDNTIQNNPPMQQSSVRPYFNASHNPYQSTRFPRGTYVPRGRGGGRPPMHRQYHNEQYPRNQSPEEWANQGGPSPWRTPRRLPNDEPHHASTSYVNQNGFNSNGQTHNDHGRTHGHYQHNKPYHDNRSYHDNKPYHNNERYHENKPHHRTYNGDRSARDDHPATGGPSSSRYAVPDEDAQREGSYSSSANTDAMIADLKERSPSRERAVSIDPSDRAHTPVRGRSLSRGGN